MAINPYHIVEEINGKRCSVVEKKISAERAAFLKSILESSKQEVEISADENGECTIGVTNIIFNTYYALYSRMLRTPEGKVVTPAIWFQKQQTGQFYWNY